MRRTFSDRWLVPALVGVVAATSPLAAQEEQAAPGSRILSSDIALSSDEAELRLELVGGETLTLLLADDGAVRMNGSRIGAYERRDGLDQSWRTLLQRAMDAPTGTLHRVLIDWAPPSEAGGVGRRLDRELEAALLMADARTGQAAANAAAAGAAAAAENDLQRALDQAGDASDSITLLNQRIRELEALIGSPDASFDAGELPALRELRRDLERELRAELRSEIRDELRNEIQFSSSGYSGWDRWWRNMVRAIGGIFSTLMVYAILVGLGFLAVFFGKPYLEAVADTARHQTLRSGLVGLAGSFLVLPAFILGILALAISIVGIPLLLVFIPLFPVAVVIGAAGGYLAVAHGAGEALAERRFTGSDWFSRANSYYYVITGVGLLLVLYIAAHVLSMVPWFGFFEGLLHFLAVMLTWVAATVGFGAVLISRGGTRPVHQREGAGLSDLEDELHA